MDILANDLSIHGQFHDIRSFRDAFGRLMRMRRAARRAGHEIHCHRALLAVEVMPGVPMQQALQRLTMNECRAAMNWLTKSGPFWDDIRRHVGDDYLECRGDVVTDSAVGEAAFRVMHDVECGLASVTPSGWDFSPVKVAWKRDEGIDDRCVDLKNWLDAETMENQLRPAAVVSWPDLARAAADRYERLTFSDDCFRPLAGIPFARSSADRVVVLLGTLNRLALSYDKNGNRTAEGHRLYQDHFTGLNAWFSDSSDTEKHDFRNELTFPHPDRDGTKIFCPWHGKEHSSILRLHFSWPIRYREPVYVAYVGPKLTKR